jgi:hypothetical protein
MQLPARSDFGWLSANEISSSTLHYNFLDLSRKNGTIKPVAGQEAVWNKAVQLYNYAVSNTGSRSSSISTSAKGSDTYVTTISSTCTSQFEQHVGRLQNHIDLLASGSQITGYTGKSGDVLNVKSPSQQPMQQGFFRWSSPAMTVLRQAHGKYLPTSGSYQGIAGFT